jgi:hypothetical protein
MHRDVQSGPKVDIQLRMFSRKFEMSSLETEFVKLPIPVQLDDNLFSGTLHITWNQER